MLHRILHHPFSLSSSSSYLSPHLLSSSSSSQRRVQGMELLVQGDFGGGFVSKTAANGVVFNDDDGGVNGGGAAGGGTGTGTGDDFFVDELLDFSNGYSETEEQALETDEPPEKSSLVSQEKKQAVAAAAPPPENSHISPGDDFASFHESKLIVPAAEGLESLEWLSHFVEDSFSTYPLTGKLPTENKSKPAAPPMKPPPCFTTPVQTKARTKRARTGVRVWPVLSPSFASTSTSTTTSSSSSSTSSTLWIVESGDSASGKAAAAAKKRKGRPADLSGGGGAAQQRRCSHCGVTKTPQWRAGPLGVKTLCNACGVRYKSGRLLPEYRPACSPTFSTELHSNSHRKVLEMRRKKEVEKRPEMLDRV